MSSHVSVLHLDRAAVRELKITDRYGLHRAVYSLFPNVRAALDPAASVGLSSGILFAEAGSDEHSSKILMLSDRIPAARVFGRYGQVESKPLPASFFNHAQYRFEIDINPTRCNSKSGKREAIRGREAVAEWMLSRAPRWGFDLDPARLVVDKIEVLRFQKGASAVVLGQASVSGTLKVIDRDAFEKSVLLGLGKARAFGCGLLRAKPILSASTQPSSLQGE